MHRAMLTACLPWLAALMVSVLLAYFLLRISRARLQLGRLFQLHRDQAGGVQSLSFVLTLPIFIMVMMLIVQISQVMIGLIVVQYAAFAAARSAIVWIPADLSRIEPYYEGPNCIGNHSIPDPENQVFPQNPYPTKININGQDIPVNNFSDFGPIPGGVSYRVEPCPIFPKDKNSPKCEKICSAAVLACTGISPSRNVGYTLENSPALLEANAPPGNTSAVDAGMLLADAYLAISPGSAKIPAVPGRLRNKLAYALHNTWVEIRFYHQNTEPPLKIDENGWQGPYIESDFSSFEFAQNELGRQDLVTVKVNHNLALLPGPGRLLAHHLKDQPDKVSDSIQHDKVYYYPIAASAALNVEGEKSVIPYVY